MRAHIGIRQFIVVHMVGDWSDPDPAVIRQSQMNSGNHSAMPLMALQIVFIPFNSASPDGETFHFWGVGRDSHPLP